MGTRSGDLDPAVVEFVCKKENSRRETRCVRILNKESGVMALSNGLSSDFRDLEEAMEQRQRGMQSLQLMHSATVLQNTLVLMWRQ